LVTKQTGFKHRLHNNISLIKPTLQYKQENNQVDKKLILKIVAPSKYNAKHFRKKKNQSMEKEGIQTLTTTTTTNLANTSVT
jgi:predicted HTH transcriptional regulator